MDRILNDLLSAADPGYRDFTVKLIPNIEPRRIIGVRAPAIKALAKKYHHTPEAQAFLEALPHDYLEENHLHAALLCREKDFEACLSGVLRFLPHVDNWATCDSLVPPVFKRNASRLTEPAFALLQSEHPYACRYGIAVFMRYFLDEAFDPVYPRRIAALRSDEYYVNMMIAWYFATALAKQYDAVVPLLQTQALDRWTHNKAIQKAIESDRIDDAEKSYLRTLKRKQDL